MTRITWSPTTLAATDDDGEYASNGSSRYGAYLEQNLDRLSGFDGPFETMSFAVGAWWIATERMNPCYVRIRADLAAITVDAADGEPDLLVATVTVPLSHAHLTAGRTLRSSTWRDWTRDTWTGSAPYHHHVGPDERHKAILTTAQVRVPIPAGDLPAPSHTCATGRVTDAKAAVQALCDRINHLAGQQVADLTGRTLTHV